MSNSILVFANFFIHLILHLHLWKISPESKFRTAAQSLVHEEVEALKKLGIKVEYNDSTICNRSAGYSCHCNYKSTCYVTNLWLRDVGLIGPIPDEVAYFTHLKTLDFSGNYLTGNIPDFLGNMASLYSLDLSRNDFSGYIPKSLGNLKGQTQLEKVAPRFGPYVMEGKFCPIFKLDLSRNRLDGDIPETLGNITVYLTNFGGTYENNRHQPEIGKCRTTMFYMDLSYNYLSGEIPASLGKMKYLQSL